jgi:hypothetical protein
LFKLLADDGNQLPRIVGVSGIGENMLLGIVTNSVFVTAQDTDGVGADAEPRAGNKVPY